MKLSTLLIMVFLLHAGANPGYSQKAKVTIDAQHAKLSDILEQVEYQTSYLFFYNKKNIDINKEVNLNVTDVPVSEVLNKALGSDISYVMVNEHIILSKREDKTMLPLIVIQGITVAGTITDETGAPIPGVNVVVKGTTSGVISDFNGKYSIMVSNKEAMLVFSFVGYLTNEFLVGDQSTINVMLEEDSREIEEVVVIGYGVQKKGNLTGSVASLSAKEMTVAPVASTANALAGRLPGLIALQSSGQPGSDASSLNIRGFGNALVIVDGIEANFNYIDPNQIESISILKDGSAAIYGSRAGNGVILITTKRGVEQKPTVTLNTALTLQGITAMPKPSSAGQYAEMEREKWIQSGNPEEQAPFTADQIQKYYDGTDPQYPNTDWYKELVRDWAPMQQYNLSIRGGGNKIKYYGFLGYMDQQSMWKNHGGNYDRYNLQSNIDASITDNLTLQLDLTAVYEESVFPVRGLQAGGNTVWQDFWNTLPIYPATLPDPTKVSYANGQGTGGAHVTSNYDLSGYQKSSRQNLRGTGTLNYKFKAVDGLSAKFFINYMGDYLKGKRFNKPVSYYTYDIASDTYTQAGALGNKAQLSQDQNQGSMITTQFSVNYDKVLAVDHHLMAVAVYEGIRYQSDWFSAGRDEFLTVAIEEMFGGNIETAKNNGSASEMGRRSFVGRFNYSYKNKYLLETSFRADASAKFPSDERWGYFPSVSLGWRISEEEFMDNALWADDLKLRANYGSSGNDFVGNFQYLAGYKIDGNYLIGPSAQQGIISTGMANPYLTWEKIKVYNVGANWSLWQKKIYGEADIFYRSRSGIPATRYLTVPSTFGAGLPPENLNSLNDRGFEFVLGTAKTQGDFTYDISGNISWSRAKWDHYEEAEYTDPDEDRINRLSGRWTDRRFGYRSDGLFTSQQQITELKFDQDTKGNTTLRPGDIRYVDDSGDGKLDWRDQVEIGKGTMPHWMYGIYTNAKYKDFDIAALFQGAFGYYTDVVMIRTNLVYPEKVYELRWTEDNNDPQALVPRLGGSSLNGELSDYRYKSAGYLRLKILTIGYSLPQSLLSKVKIQQARVYLSGTNLLTFDKLRKYDLDPEAPSSMAGFYYPQQCTLSLGLNVSF